MLHQNKDLRECRNVDDFVDFFNERDLKKQKTLKFDTLLSFGVKLVFRGESQGFHPHKKNAGDWICNLITYTFQLLQQIEQPVLAISVDEDLDQDALGVLKFLRRNFLMLIKYIISNTLNDCYLPFAAGGTGCACPNAS